MMIRRRSAPTQSSLFPALLFNVEDSAVAARLHRALTREGYRVAVDGNRTAPADAAGETLDAVLVPSRRPVDSAVADARRRCPGANVVSTIVVDGVIIAQPFDAAPESAAPQLVRIRALAATVRAALQAA